MKCPKCQHDIPDDSMFCNKCGHDLNKTTGTYSEIYNEPKSYTPKFLADKILKSKSSLIGERKLVTVLFADVVNYTAMSEKLDPEDIHQIMDGCFKILMDEIHRYEGTINQFTGDGVMALFGAPLSLEDHAQDACRAALSIQKAIKKYSHELESRFGLQFQMRIGLNSGPVIVGSIGDDLRMDYTAIGDTTNLAARMESMAKPGTVLVSPGTYENVWQQFELKPLGKAEIKGKEEPLELYELIKDKVHRPRLGKERRIYSEMVGRENDLNRLELQVTKAFNGEGSVVNVIGEAGIGKSRLISELRKSSVVKRATLLEGRAISIGRNLSFYPIIDFLKNWARIIEDDREATALGKLETAIKSVSPEGAEEIVPFVATLIGMKLSGRYAERVKGIEGEALEKLILKNVRELIAKLTELTPLVIVIEDLHWADTSSIELLEALFRLAETKRILFINVFRPDHKETGERIVETIQKKLPVYYVEINLEPLTEKMSGTLIDNMLNIKGLHYGIKNKIAQRAGGNPFFIEEVVRSFIDEGAVIVKDGKFEVTEKIENMIIPNTINDVLMARIDRLEEGTRNLVKVASVIGRNFFHRILSEVANTVDDVDSRLSYLKEIQIIRERNRLEELEYLFKHALAQEAAYESILHQKRKEIHLQVAQSIEKVFKERLHEFYGMLAIHYSKGEDYESAEYYLVKAGEEALRSSASSEALNYYQEGLRLYQLRKGTNDPEKLAMFEKNIAIALYNKSRFIEAVEHIDKTLKYWEIAIPKNKIWILFVFIKNIIFIVTGLYQLLKNLKPNPTHRDEEVLELFYKKAHALTSTDLMVLIFTMLNGFNKSVKFDVAKSRGSINMFFVTAGGIAYSGISKILPYKLLRLASSALDSNDIHSSMLYELHYTVSNLLLGNWRNRRPFKSQLVENAFKKGGFFNAANYLWFFTVAKIKMGDFEEAKHLIDKTFEAAEIFNNDLSAINAYGMNTVLLLKRARLFEAGIEAEKGIAMCKQQNGMEHHQLWFLGLKAEAFIWSGNVEQAEESLSQGKSIADQKTIPSFLLFAPYLFARFMMDIQLLIKALDSDDKTHIPNLKKKADASGKKALKNMRKYAPCQTKTFRLMGEYSWVIGKQKKALKWWDKAIKRGEELGARPDLSRTYFEVGKRLLEPGSKYKILNGITAEEYLQKARTLFEEMDLQWDLDELDKVLATK